jgi:hypothetical protein
MEKLMKMMTVAFDKHAEEIEWREAQMTYCNAQAAIQVVLDRNDKEEIAQAFNLPAMKECEAANRRLFALFSAGWSDETYMFKAFWAYKHHLLYHTRAQS